MAPKSVAVAGAKPSELAVRVRYTKTVPIRVRGPVTRREYAFSAQHPVQVVDVRDAQALLRGRIFRPA